MPRTSVDRATSVDRDSLIADLHREPEPELYLKRFERNISEARLLDYLRFYAKLKILEFSSDISSNKVHFHSDFVPADNDPRWVNALAEQAKLHLEPYLTNENESVDDGITAAINAIHNGGGLSTPRALADRQDFDTNRDEEQFRWALYLYLDGDACPITLRRVDILRRPAEGAS
jgi:hypothetical protein